MAIHWSNIVGSISEVERLRGLYPEVSEWDEPSIANHIPKAWKRVATISIGEPGSQEHERTEFASIYSFGFMLFYRSSDQEFGPIAADFPSSILFYYPGWEDIDKNGIVHVDARRWDLDIDILDAIRGVTPPWNCFSLNDELLELDLDGEIKPYDPDRASDY